MSTPISAQLDGKTTNIITLLAAGTTGSGTTFDLPFVGKSFQWQSVLSGGTLTAITINFEGLNLDGTTYNTMDSSTVVGGEMKIIAPNTKFAGSVRASVTVFTVATGTPIMTIYARAFTQ